MYIVNKNKYIFLRSTGTPLDLNWFKYTFMKPWKWVWGIPILPWLIFEPTYILKKNIGILHKNMYIFLKANRDLVRPYYVLNIHLENLRKWFEAFSHPEFQFWTSCISLRKISTFFHKNIYTFLKANKDPIRPYYF